MCYGLIVLGLGMSTKRRLNKTLKISPEVHTRLINFGRKSETIDDIISRLLDIAEKRDKNEN